ncbi:helix-turn-helix domain-containing protein [Actinophytocola algeriensis]|uniref:Transcriptional regulator with XRE-family HTH domain n=1 Tax=Actinophytocola algeriensis TaxID=1768010 RepID=A0A7W7VBH9_9PSEU|nr:helix-turn-helix transcriptional regulator [Actinophytocola algeriensis]MBB4903991.1 transcriptional regulator with XRE-family HTH domain [Actinophytocola algeriensis]MBE1477152.1 transcriptional regulator with XRE-family HTH domain [Actinophytocola algeriensis]
MESQGTVVDLLDIEDEATANAIARALGDELRRGREARGWSRAWFVKRLPSRIGDRTLLAYEHGMRQLTVLRLVELAEGLEVPASVILGQALQRARLTLHNLVLRVDLRQLLQGDNNNYRVLFPWARNRLNSSTNGVIEVTPTGVQELAAFIGRTPAELATHLSQFTPDVPVEEVMSLPI